MQLCALCGALPAGPRSPSGVSRSEGGAGAAGGRRARSCDGTARWPRSPGEAAGAGSCLSPRGGAGAAGGGLWEVVRVPAAGPGQPSCSAILAAGGLRRGRPRMCQRGKVRGLSARGARGRSVCGVWDSRECRGSAAVRLQPGAAVWETQISLIPNTPVLHWAARVPGRRHGSAEGRSQSCELLLSLE